MDEWNRISENNKLLNSRNKQLVEELVKKNSEIAKLEKAK